MADPRPGRIWVRRGTFVVLAFVLIVLQLVPQSMEPTVMRLPDLFGGGPTLVPVVGPDILLAVTLCWVVRRPDYLPVLVIAVIFLFCDLLFQRPPGLWAALVVLLTETLRSRSRDIRNIPLLLEWGTVAFGIVAITLGNRLVLAIVATPQAPLGLTIIQTIATIACYPLVVLAAHVIFRVRRPAPGETNVRGHRV